MSAAEPARTPPPAPPGPLLPARISPRVWVRVDWAVAVLCGVCCYFPLVKTARLYHPFYIGWAPVGWLPLLVLAAAVAAAVAIRRRDPTRALTVALGSCAAALAVGGVLTSGLFVPLGLVLFTAAATRARGWLAGLAGALALLAINGVAMHVNGTGPGDAIFVSLVLIIIWLAGYTVYQRRVYSARVREQVASAAVTEERLRIARELHDVVAHSMTVVAVQAGFGEYVFEREPGEARAALGAIQQVTREALADMQRLLGVLRQGEGGSLRAGQDDTGEEAAPAPAAPAAPDGTGQGNGHRPARPLQLAPAPGLADLDRLVATTAAAGVRVDLIRAAGGPDIPAAIGQSAFRIVQEALTNVVKHSGAGTCRVVVDCPGGDLCVEITDPGAPTRPGAPAHPGGGGWSGPGVAAGGTGHGIIGMRERVSLCGGEFTAGPLPGRGFRVTARFPLGGAAHGAVPRSGAR